MENQSNPAGQNLPQVGQNPVVQPVAIAKTNYLTIVGVALICSLIFGFGGYYLGKQSSNSKYVNNEVQTNPTATPYVNSPTSTTNPSSTLDPTANWKTYTNSEVGFRFKYPSEWKTQTGIPNSGLISLETSHGNRFFVWFSQSVTLAEWLEETQSGKIIGKKTIGDYTFTVVQGGLMFDSLEYVVDVKGKGIIRFVIEPNTDSTKSENTFSQILSTFKLTQ